MRKLLITSSLMVCMMALGTVMYVGLNTTSHLPLLFGTSMVVMGQTTIILSTMRKQEIS